MKLKSTVCLFYPYQLATISFNTEERICVYMHIKDVEMQTFIENRQNQEDDKIAEGSGLRYKNFCFV